MVEAQCRKGVVAAERCGRSGSSIRQTRHHGRIHRRLCDKAPGIDAPGYRTSAGGHKPEYICARPRNCRLADAVPSPVAVPFDGSTASQRPSSRLHSNALRIHGGRSSVTRGKYACTGGVRPRPGGKWCRRSSADNGTTRLWLLDRGDMLLGDRAAGTGGRIRAPDCRACRSSVWDLHRLLVPHGACRSIWSCHMGSETQRLEIAGNAEQRRLAGGRRPCTCACRSRKVGCIG